MNSLLDKARHWDIPLLAAGGMLLLAGLVMQYSTSLSSQNLTIFWRQISFVVAGIGVYIFFGLYNYYRVVKLHRLLYIAILSLLFFVLLFASSVKGSHRWINIGYFNLQPAEFCKIVIIIGLARILTVRRGSINTWTNIGLTLLYILLPVVLVIREPDLGSALTLVGIWAGVLLVSPIKKYYFILLIIIAIIGSGISWQWILKPYQKQRIEVFIDPEVDPQGKGYNVRQAIIAVGSGGWFGKGLGKGLQSQLRFLPERQTDFVFASTAEEVGFLGTGVVVALYLILLWRLILIAYLAKDSYGLYITTGVFFMFLIQITVNIGMNMGIMPVTGIPLPFLTYGGSSLLTSMIALGLVQNICSQARSLRF